MSQTTERRTLVIDRSRWARTNQGGKRPNGDSFLLNSKGCMCCLGFDCANLGVKNESLFRVSMPHDSSLLSSLPRGLQSRAARINDRSCTQYAYVSDAVQEAAIIDVFADVGVDVMFVDGV